ncbi:MAG: PhoU domain-containing protein, partial [Clostridia bacterium]|nr:PhoU domain-containing protein [Clostridia bacterium]
ETAGRVEPLEQVIDGLIATVKDHHINRLVTGNCTIELGFILSDILTNLERISDHCSNIAVTLIQLGNSSFETHQYLNGIKYGNDEAFERQFAEYAEKYRV